MKCISLDRLGNRLYCFTAGLKLLALAALLPFISNSCSEWKCLQGIGPRESGLYSHAFADDECRLTVQSWSTLGDTMAYLNCF